MQSPHRKLKKIYILKSYRVIALQNFAKISNFRIFQKLKRRFFMYTSGPVAALAANIKF